MGSLRFMRMIVFFDLPTITSEDRQNYRNFRKLLITNGFMLLQKNKPPQGVIQTLMITEKQFSKMNFIIGESTNDIVDSEDRLVVL